MPYIYAKYVYGNQPVVEEVEREERHLFENMNPTNQRFNAILNGKSCSLGFLNFKRAKLVSPLKPFVYKKYTKIDTVKANKKWFRAHSEWTEFAKPYMPVANWHADIAQREAERKLAKEALEAINKRKEEKAKNKNVRVNHFTGKDKPINGLCDRFADGKAWYYSNHTEG